MKDYDPFQMEDDGTLVAPLPANKEMMAGMKRIHDLNTYDPDALYVRSTDFRGHSDQIHLTIPQSELAMIHTFLAADVGEPFASPQALFRHSIFKFMYESCLQNKSYDTLAIVEAEIALRRMEETQARIKRFRDVIDNVGTALNQALMDGDENSFLSTYIDARRVLPSLDPPYSQQLATVMENNRNTALPRWPGLANIDDEMPDLPDPT
jgi:hypothetical protein